MAKKPETLFAEKIDQDLHDRFGTNCWIENIQQVAKSGTADRLCCIRGVFVALEIKTDLGAPSKLQLMKLKLIEKAGGIGRIVRPDTWNRILDEIDTMTFS